VLLFKLLAQALQWLVDSGVFDIIIAAIKLFGDGLTWLINNFDLVIAAIVQFFSDIWNALTTAWNAIVEFFKGIWDAITTALTTVWNAIAGFFKGIWDGILTVWDTFVSAFNTAWLFLKGSWDGILAFFKAIGTGLQTIWDGIYSAFKAFVNFFIGIINGIIDLLNKLDVLNVIADIPKLPTLQTGGKIVKTGAAIVDRGEAVINAGVVSMLATIVSDIRRNTMSGSSRTINNTINAVVMSHENARMVAREVNKQTWLSGD
jgi:phage-related protein